MATSDLQLQGKSRMAVWIGGNYELLKKHAKGQDLFDQIVYHLDLVETDYFGLQFLDSAQVAATAFQPHGFPESQGCDSIMKDSAVSLCSLGCQAFPSAGALALCSRRDVHGEIRACFPGHTPADAQILQALKPFKQQLCEYDALFFPTRAGVGSSSAEL
ncbi:hypothetical protein J1605_001240 [Eschrichtius robustus]|uniref:FERM N-terminal domain-containing protein n=1 Tax=Eschrichtius robustus TaxID=9764 RepID=A0AB34GB32_ESCRO|nr:hypothetical protein J1605_001240 [Eschrichtius robustus]